ncbi:WhiB family transcriptional regulator [Streptomyces sp. NPDC001843]|uniref:WhiB family transcriptional regulator n=1 Tax=Streptomyces sp. NPDC001843 TaxID=3364617 RepID=UPI0036BAABBA
MVLFDPHRKWGPRGICRYEDRGLFFAEGMHNRKPAEAVQALWNQAKEICAMCPVLQECKRDTLGEEYGVFGGLDQFERYKIRRALPQAVRNWPRERQLAWGKELSVMREGGLSWATIQAQCGMPQSAAEFLINRWRDEPKRPVAAKTKIVDLQLPSVIREKPEFPVKPGRRHAWVRHRGVVSDAFYRGETPDGEWLCLTTVAGRGQVHKWFRKEDVRMYSPQVVVILNYAARPTGHAAENAMKTHCVNGHLFSKANTRVDKRGWRICRACHDGREAEDREEEPAHAAA